MPPPARLSKQQREALARQDAPFLARELVFTEPRSNEAHLRQTARLLADRQVHSPCARAVSHIVDLFERSIPREKKAMLACRTGCSFCCHQPVAVTAPEAFYLAGVLVLRPEAAAAMAVMAARTADRRADQAGITWFPCPLLDGEGSCTAYRARPTACRAYVSINVEDCKANYLAPGSVTVMEPQGYTPIKDRFRVMLLAAMRANGLPTHFYEMNAAVSVILATDNAEKRWLRGENIFGDLPTLIPPSALIDKMVTGLAEFIAPAL
jgi:Fe-S-cluster containining protein